MIKNKLFHIKIHICVQAIFLICFLFFGQIVKAQDDSAVPEKVQPTLAPGDDDETGDDDEEMNVRKYFLAFDADTILLQQRIVPDSIKKSMQSNDDFWYANADIKNKKRTAEKSSPKYTSLWQQEWVRVLLWMLIIGVFAAVIISYLGNSKVGLFRKRSNAGATEDEDNGNENIFEINYQKEIDFATAQGNYRVAVRLMFLRLLKNMAEKNVINYKQDKTNFDYLLELHSTTYYNDFFRITRNYEYSWYGKFEVSEAAFKIIRTDFDYMEKKLR